MQEQGKQAKADKLQASPHVVRTLAELRRHRPVMAALLRRRRTAKASRHFEAALEWIRRYPHWRAYLDGEPPLASLVCMRVFVT